MSRAIVCVGFTCPLCGARVAVLRSCDPTPDSPEVFHSECKCGYVRLVAMNEIQSLDVWREEAA